MELLRLPDELLLMILKNVSSNDVLSVARTCTRFADLTADRRLVMTLNFRHETMLRCDLLKSFLSSSARTDEITTIDLTSCHWLPSTFLMNVLLRLRNVENILVADTALSFNHLKRVLTNLTRVKRLSWSWRKGACSSGLELALKNLIFLYLCVHDLDHVIELSSSSFLECCENLKELWVVCVPSQQDCPPLVLNKRVSQVERLVVCHTNVLNVQSDAAFTHCWSPHTKFAGDMINLEVLLAKTWEEAKNICPSNINSIKRLSIIELVSDLNLEIFLGQMSGLTALHLMLPGDFSETIFSGNKLLEELSLSFRERNCSTKICDSVSFCSCLKRLVLPVGALVCNSLQPNILSSMPKARISRVIGAVPEGTITPFKKMVYNTPLVEEFEVGTTASHIPVLPRSLQWDLHSLSSIAQWKMLSSLTLANLPIVDGKFFAPILMGCKSLKELKILNLGSRVRCIYAKDLYCALRYSESLMDFEWEQANVGNTLLLWESLSEVKTIQRLSLRHSGVSDISEEGVIQFLENCHSVIFLFVLSGATQIRCTSLKRKICDRWSKQRPALIVQFLSSSQANWREKVAYIPAVHLGEMWMLKSRITNLPTSSSRFMSFRFSDPVSWAPHV